MYFNRQKFHTLSDSDPIPESASDTEDTEAREATDSEDAVAGSEAGGCSLLMFIWRSCSMTWAWAMSVSMSSSMFYSYSSSSLMLLTVIIMGNTSQYLRVFTDGSVRASVGPRSVPTILRSAVQCQANVGTPRFRLSMFNLIKKRCACANLRKLS